MKCVHHIHAEHIPKHTWAQKKVSTVQEGIKDLLQALEV